MGQEHNHEHHKNHNFEEIVLKELRRINFKLKNIMATQQEIAQQLTALKDQITKIGTETSTTLQKVADLEAALGNQEGVTPELQAAFDALKLSVQNVDDLIPDAPTA